jgi:hypothetical protein
VYRYIIGHDTPYNDRTYAATVWERYNLSIVFPQFCSTQPSKTGGPKVPGTHTRRVSGDAKKQDSWQ